MLISLSSLIRTIGSNWGGYGPNQPGHEGCRKKLGGPGKMLWALCVTMETVNIFFIRYKHLLCEISSLFLIISRLQYHSLSHPWLFNDQTIESFEYKKLYKSINKSYIFTKVARHKSKLLFHFSSPSKTPLFRDCLYLTELRTLREEVTMTRHGRPLRTGK